MKTDPIYMINPYQKEMDASIVEVIKENSEIRVVLDKTVFYPMGGGQPTDQGKLILKDGSEVEVYQVMIKDGEINHYIKTEKDLKAGDSVKGKIDWDRRFKHMKTHSAGHVIDFAIYILGYSPDILTPQKGDHGKKPFIIYSGEVAHDIKEEIQKKVDELLVKNPKFSWEFEDLEKLKDEAIYLQPGLPINKPLRVLRLESVGAVADGGTIVEWPSEIGKIEITEIKVENGNTTVHYKVEENNVNPKKIENTKGEVNSSDSSSLDLSKYGIDINALNTDVNEDIVNAKDEDELTLIWRKYLGKDGHITAFLKKITEVSDEDKKAFGQELNRLKNEIDQKINDAKANLGRLNETEYLNRKVVELDYKKPKIGHTHPLTQTTNDLNEIFRKLGYSVLDGPEIETDEYCFQRLNLPLDHPARDLQDSIYIEEPNILLRTQTSSIEARALETFKPPFKVVMPGRVYRNEKVNRSNHFTFHQYQLTVVKEKVSMAELFATINHLFKSYYGDDVEIRFRCKYYPEVEPGVGPDMKCFNCHGSGKLDDDERCGVCKGRGWIEMGGAGIIHPNVLKMAGLDPEKWQGYAFGMGLDRWAMAKYKIDDIRTLLGGNLAYRPNVS